MQVSKKMKKLLFACIFSTVVVLVLKMASFLMAPQRIGMQNAVSAGEKYYLNLLMEPEDMVDVIIFGDSESISFLSTYDLWKDCGIASYVAGQPGDRVVRSYYKLKEILKTQSPKVVILETNELYFNADTLNQIDYIRESVIDYYFHIIVCGNSWYVKAIAVRCILMGLNYDRKVLHIQVENICWIQRSKHHWQRR
mgnify:CR=1 FL=1